MTPRQAAMVDVIAGWTRLHGYPPSVREIATAMGYASTQPVSYHLAQLREEGVIDYVDGKARTVRVRRTQ